MSRAVSVARPVGPTLRGGLLRGLLRACGVAGIGILTALLLVLLVGSLWPAGVPGSWIAPMAGTAAVAGVAVLIAVPLGVAVAVTAREYALVALGRPVLAFARVMIGVPPIVYGAFGAAVFVSAFGAGALAGGLTLGVLALPAVAVATDEALREVDPKLRLAATALGASRFQVVWRVVLPEASRGIMRSVLLAIISAVGQTAPLLVTGAALVAADDGVVTLTTALYAQGDTGFGQQAFQIAFMLAAVSAGARIFADRLVRPREAT